MTARLRTPLLDLPCNILVPCQLPFATICDPMECFRASVTQCPQRHYRVVTITTKTTTKSTTATTRVINNKNHNKHIAYKFDK